MGVVEERSLLAAAAAAAGAVAAAGWGRWEARGRRHTKTRPRERDENGIETPMEAPGRQRFRAGDGQDRTTDRATE